MGPIHPIGLRPTQPIHPGKPVPTLSSEVMDTLKDMGISSIRAIRIQQGVVGTLALKEMATVTLNHDQKMRSKA